MPSLQSHAAKGWGRGSDLVHIRGGGEGLRPGACTCIISKLPELGTQGITLGASEPYFHDQTLQLLIIHHVMYSREALTARRN